MVRKAAMMNRTSSFSTYRASPPGWAAVVTAFGIIGLTLGCLWGLFRGGAHIRQLLTVFIAVLCLALVVLIIESLSKRRLLSEVALFRDRLHKALFAGNSVAWDLDDKTGCDVWFGDLERLFGIPSETVCVHFQDFYRYVHPEDRARVSGAVAEARGNRSPYAVEFRVVHEDGTIRWVSASGEFQYTKEGEPTRMLGVAVDITERKQSNEALVKSEEKFAKAFRSSPVILTLTRVRDHRYLDVNETFEQITGWNRDEVIGRTPLDIKIWVDPAKREEAVNLVLAKKSVRNFEVRYRCKNGLEGVGLASAEFIEIDGEPCLLSAIVDITDRKRTEDELRLKESELARMQGEAVATNFEHQGIRRDGGRVWIEAEVVPIHDRDGKPVGSQKLLREVTERKRAEQVLRESEERFRLVANTAPVMIWMAGTDKLCNYFNKPWLDFTGRPLEAELGNGWAEGVHPEDLHHCLQCYREAFDRREAFELQYRLRRSDGEFRWMLDIGAPRFDPDGSFTGYIGSCIDITDRKLAEEALATIGRRLIEAHEEERTWIGRELHDDINQRLALLAVELDRWNQDVPSSAELHEQVRHAQQRITEIAKDVQSLSHRLHSSKLEYLGLAKAAGSFCRELSEQTGVEVNFSHRGIPRTLPQDVSLCVFRVLQEALQNAVKHSGVRNFKVELHGTSEKIELTVVDMGSGFEKDEAFTRQGLGLISMRERLQLVNGELSVKSKPGAGTTIYARVPLNSVEYRAVG
jgi:PAS domain S-box-containing protein